MFTSSKSSTKINRRAVSKWIAWDKRDELENLQYPGVYILAYSKPDLTGKAFSWIEEIVYVGMTNSAGGLNGRLKQFDNTIKNKRGHGGAERFNYEYDPRKNVLRRLLYVAVAPFKCTVVGDPPEPKDLIIMGDVAKAEYEGFARYVEAFKRLPKYNDRKASPKRPNK